MMTQDARGPVGLGFRLPPLSTRPGDLKVWPPWREMLLAAWPRVHSPGEGRLYLPPDCFFASGREGGTYEGTTLPMVSIQHVDTT